MILVYIFNLERKQTESEIEKETETKKIERERERERERDKRSEGARGCLEKEKKTRTEISEIEMNLYISMLLYWVIGLMSRVFANGPADRGSITGQVILKTQKMVLDATLLSTQHYKVRIQG